MENETVIILALCETEFVKLKPDVLYRFNVIADCKECERLAEEAKV